MISQDLVNMNYKFIFSTPKLRGHSCINSIILSLLAQLLLVCFLLILVLPSILPYVEVIFLVSTVKYNKLLQRLIKTEKQEDSKLISM